MPKWLSTTKRRDGLYIFRLAGGRAWGIVSPRGLATERCPCCGKPCVSKAEARQVADFAFLVEASPPADEPS
jgi:hypothetical protein